MTQGYKHDTGLQTRHRATNMTQGYKHDIRLQIGTELQNDVLYTKSREK